MGNSTNVICGTVLLLAVMAGIFVLTWHGTISGGEAITMATAIVGIAGGAFAVHAGVKAGSSAASPVVQPIAPTKPTKSTTTSVTGE